METVQVGIAGFGRIAPVHLMAWGRTEGTTVVAVADPDRGARKHAAQQGLRAFETLEQMLESVKLGAVSICAPPSTHLGLAEAALRHHAGVLCEMPATPSLGQTNRLIEAVRAAAGVFQVATKFRHVSEIQTARKLIQEGEIGQPIQLDVAFAGIVDMSHKWNSKPELSGGGVLIDNGSHAFDLAVYLLGPVHSVRSTRQEQNGGLAVEDSAKISAAMACGARADISVTWSAPPTSDLYLTVRGTKGLIAIGWKASYFQRRRGEPIQIGAGYDKVAAHDAMMRQFLGLLRGEGQEWISREEVLANSAAIDAAYRSMQSGDWTPVGTHLSPARAA